MMKTISELDEYELNELLEAMYQDYIKSETKDEENVGA